MMAIASGVTRTTIRIIPILDAFLETAATVERDRALNPLATQMERGLARAFAKQGRAFLASFGQFRDRFPVEEAIGDRELFRAWDRVAASTRSAFLSLFRSAGEAAIVRGGRGLIADVRIDLALRRGNAEATRWLERHGAAMVRGIEDTTRDRLRTLLVQAQREKWPYSQLEREITARFREFGAGTDGSIPRARLIAHNEMRTAWEQGRRIVAADLTAGGIPLEVKWTTVGDSRVTAECRANEAAGWVAFGNAFPSGHENPPRFPGCRCHSVYRRARG